MDEKIHNPRIAKLQIVVDTHEKDVINGNKVAKDLTEFNALYKELKDIIKEYRDLYLETNDEKYKKELDAYLAQEVDYLNLINELMSTLDTYHDVVGFVDGHEVQAEWEDARVIIQFHNIERQLKVIEYFIQDSLDNSYAEQYQNLMKQREELIPAVIEAEAHIIEKEQTEYNSMERDAIVERETDILLDYAFLDSLPLITEKIDYVMLVLKNMEKIKGKKELVHCNGEKKEIAKKYANRYRKYIAILNNLNAKYEEEREYIIGDVLEERQDIAAPMPISNQDSSLIAMSNQYADLIIKASEVERAIFLLGEEAKPALNTDRVIAVPSVDDKPLFVLKTRVAKFNELYDTYQSIKQFIIDFKTKNKLMIIDSEKEYENVQLDEKKIFNKIQFLKEQSFTNPEVKSEIQKLQEELFYLNEEKTFSTLANLKVLFKTSGISEQLSVLYGDVVTSISDFLKSKKYSDPEKKSIFSSLSTIIRKFMNHEEKNEISLPLLEDKSMSHKPIVSKIITEHFSKVQQGLASISDRAASKIKAFRKAKDKKKMNANVCKVAKVVAASLGSVSIIGASFVSGYNIGINHQSTNLESYEEDLTKDIETDVATAALVENIFNLANQLKTAQNNSSLNPEILTNESTEESIEDEKKQENYNFGDKVTTEEGALIFGASGEASENINPQTPYFAPDSVKEITGLTYYYNGKYVFISADDPECDMKKADLESKGAIQVEFRSVNEDSSEKEYEGFYLVDDIDNNLGGQSR